MKYNTKAKASSAAMLILENKCFMSLRLTRVRIEQDKDRILCSDSDSMKSF